MKPHNEHPDWNTLALLADQGPEAVSPAVLEHLATCSACMSAWAEAARYRDQALQLGEAGFPVPRDLAARARKLARPEPVRRRPALAWGMGSLATAAALVAFLFIGGHGLRDLARQQDLIQTCLEKESASGMVFPGVARLPESDSAVYRSGDGNPRALTHALIEMAVRFTEDPSSPEEAFWLSAGYLATGRLGLAGDIARNGLRRWPGDLRILQIEAIVAYRLSDLDAAERALDLALAQAPNDSTSLFNLALTWLETGRSQQARPLLEALAASSSNAALNLRAAELLDRLNH